MLRSSLIVSCFVMGCASPPGLFPVQAPVTSPLETGDLVFLDLSCGGACDAIESSTLEQFGVEGPRLSHVGMIWVENKSTWVLEAWPEGGVKKTPLGVFLARVPGKENEPSGYYVGRLRPELRSLGKGAASHMKSLLGKPYDETFVLGDDKYYCSELVMKGFEKAGADFFSPRPMFFGRPGSPTLAYWTDYYQKLGLPVPEGQPGISPLGIYLEGRQRLFL